MVAENESIFAEIRVMNIQLHGLGRAKRRTLPVRVIARSNFQTATAVGRAVLSAPQPESPDVGIG
jgi:hypothetical protein